MTTPDVDPFAEDPIERDRWGRPKIIPVKRGGKPDLKAKLVGYTRASTFAKALDETGGLLKWSLWHCALGLGRHPDLAAMAGVFGPTVDDLSSVDKKELDNIIERAHDRSGGNVKADYGTVVHALTEPDAFGAVPDRMAADVTAYREVMQRYGLEVVDTEEFVVCDELQVAGTYDHMVRTTRDLTFVRGPQCVETILSGTLLILDKKTGKLHYDSQSIQLAVYANSKRYNPETGERDDLRASFDWGILAHIPKEDGKAELYLIDLRIGWAAAKLAGQVRKHRERKDIAVPFPTVVQVGGWTEIATDAGDHEMHATVVTPATALTGVKQAGYSYPMTDEQLEDLEELEGVDECHAVTLAPVVDEFAANLKAAERKAHEAALAKIAEKVATITAEPSFDEAVETITETFDAAPLPTLADRLNAATDRDELSAIWRADKAGAKEWTDEHTTLLRARAAELEAS